MTRETARIKVEQLDNYLSHTCQDYGERDHEAMMMAIKALEQEPILDKIFNIAFPLSIMSTPEAEHKAIMQIAEMLEPLCLPESEDKE